MFPTCCIFKSIDLPRKRSLEDEEVKCSSNKRSRVRPRKQAKAQIPTPSRSEIQRLCKSEPSPRKRVIESTHRTRAMNPTRNQTLHPSKRSRHPYAIQRWLNDRSTESVDQAKKLEDIAADLEKEPRDEVVIPSIGRSPSLLEYSINDWEVDEDQMSQRCSQVDPSNPAHAATLKQNNITIDQAGLHIPEDVKKLIDMHIRKERTSPRLDGRERAKIIGDIIRLWHKAETKVSEIIKSPIFDLEYFSLAEGGGTLWTKRPLPKDPDALYPVITPKPDRHFGFRQIIDSDWGKDQLSVVEHPIARPYLQPSCENICPCLIIEVTSEATKGNLYSAEAQAAGAGAHRVRSLLWLLDQVDPDRKRASTDAIAFTTVTSQREAVAYINFYDPDKDLYYMSFIDMFYFLKDADIQRCRDYHKNVAEWILDTMQPVLRSLLTKAYPISKSWKREQSVDTTGGSNELSASD